MKTDSREKILSLSASDFDVATFRAGGPGGQKQNKTSSAVRVTHRASGATAESRTSRSQKANKSMAFQRCVESAVFKAWLKKELSRILGRVAKAEDAVESAMKEENIKTEVIDKNGKWCVVKPSEIEQ